MKTGQPLLVTFAGAVGTSKTPIAVHLSYTFNLPIFNNDAIRSEVTEDLLMYDSEEFKRRRDERLKLLLPKRQSLIVDASIDREWGNYRKMIVGNGYRTFIISIDLSKDFIQQLHNAKIYKNPIGRIDALWQDHQNFLATYGEEVNLHINEMNFKDRLALSVEKLHEFLES